MNTTWRNVIRSTPMRLTLRLVALFTLVSLVSFAATWWMANRALLDVTETALEQKIEELSASDDPEQIARAVLALIDTADGEYQIVQYLTRSGTISNYSGLLPPDKSREVMLHDPENDIHGTYLLESENVEGGRLILGQSMEDFTDLRETFLQVLAFTLIPTALLVLAGGMLIALRSARRLSAIETTLAQLTAGNLAARLPEMPGPPDDLSRLGLSVDRLAAAQEASVEALRQVSADIAHDLKTPIQRLAVLLENARRNLPDGPTSAKLDQASTEMEGIVATFQALLRIAQIEGGSPRARFAQVDLSALVATMAEIYEPAAEEGGHHLETDIATGLMAYGDRTLLGQVVANLLENAMRHTGPGSRINLALHAGMNGPCLTISDNGPGIPEQEREAVLRRLYRLNQSRSTPGSGLGLSLVDAVVKLHHGTMRLGDNRPGLRVEVDLPNGMLA